MVGPGSGSIRGWRGSVAGAIGLLLLGCGSETSLAGYRTVDPGAELPGEQTEDLGEDEQATEEGTDEPGTEEGTDEPGDVLPEPFACSGKIATKGATLTIESGGRQRSARVHVPDSYDPDVGTMLVLNFHGYSSDDWQQELLSGMTAAADARGFIVVYPRGIANSFNAGQCCGTAWTDSVDDVTFTADLVAELSDRYCVDPAQIYATGMSNGGFFAHRLACELSDTFAAIAPVAGVIGVEQCEPTREVPVLHIHGTDDPLVPFDGGMPLTGWNVAGDLDFMSVEETIEMWKGIDSCAAQSQEYFATGDSECVQWFSCDGESEVVRCVVDGGGHTWPGGLPIPFLGKTSTDMNATDLMLDFFEAHPMPG